MNAHDAFPFRLHWTAQDLAEAVPLRLHELFAFDARRDGPLSPSANAQPHRGRRHWGYACLAALPAYFRIH